MLALSESAKKKYGSKCLKLPKSSRNTKKNSHFPKMLTLFHCVKVKQRYLSSSFSTLYRKKIFVVQGDGVHIVGSPKKITVRRAKPEKKVGQMTGNRSPHHCEIIRLKKV